MKAWLKQRWRELVELVFPGSDLLTGEPPDKPQRSGWVRAAENERVFEPVFTDEATRRAGKRVSRAARELEAALNAYPEEINAVVERHGLASIGGEPDMHVFEVQIETFSELRP